MRLVYFDCFNGAAGDMILGALIDAGAPREVVVDALEAVGLGDRLSLEQVSKGSIRATKVHVDERETSTARAYRDIVALLEAAPLDPRVRRRATDTFAALARAEARIHGGGIEDVHFHEVGAIDAIVDIVGSCAALEYFTPERIVASPIPTGRGTTQSAHGTIPVPAPAVVALLQDANLFERGEDELVTPTGAALLATWCDSFGTLPPIRIETVGYGAGTRETEIPNVVRVLVGEQQAVGHPVGRVEMIETNIDDMAPELMPYVVDRLMGAGALDAWVTPILMKKGRVAMTLSVLCDAGATKELLDIVFSETTTLGVRIGPIERAVLDRKETVVTIEGHSVRIKLGIRDGRVVTVAPEFEDAAEAARATGRPLREIYDQARRDAPDRPGDAFS